MARANQKHRKEARKEAAQKRQADYDSLTPQEKYDRAQTKKEREKIWDKNQSEVKLGTF